MKTSQIMKLMALFLIFALFSCTASPQKKQEETTVPGKSDTTQPPTIERPAIPDGTDYGGYALRVLGSDPTYMNHVAEIYAEAETGDTMNDAVYKRNRLIENMLNINIITKTCPPSDWLPGYNRFVSSAIKIIQAGEDAFDIIDGEYQPSLAFTGCLANLYDVPNMNLSKPWWDQRMIKDLSYEKKKLYYIIGDIGHFGMTGTMCCLFNKQMFEDNGFEFPYEKVRQGKWTFDEYAKLIKDAARDLNGDGAMDENDQWGLYGNVGSLLWCMLGCGEKVISVDQNGVPFINSMNERHIQVVTALCELISDKDRVLLAENMKLPDPYEAFGKMRTDGRVLFFNSTVVGIQGNRSLEYDFGIVPMPKFDENQSDYRSPATSYSSGASSISIPITNANVERTGTILEAMSGYSTDIIIPALIDVALKSKYTRDEESAEMINLILRTKMFDPLMEYGWGRLSWSGLYWDVYCDITQKGADKFVSMLEKQMPKAEKDTAKFIDTFGEMN